MKYLYQCDNEKCKIFEKVVEIDKPISESSREEFCEECKEPLNRIFTASGIKTSDGYKS